MDYKSAPLTELTGELEQLITSRPGRTYHLLPDLALKMLAAQVLQYSRTFNYLDAGNLVSWSFPVARAAFEAGEDLTYLAFAPSQEEYDRSGTLAHVGAELSISRSYRLAQEAKPDRDKPKPMPEKQRLQILISEWSRFRADAEQIVRSAYDEAKRARNAGVSSWTLLSRNGMHEAVQTNLRDPKLEKVLKSWYDLLSDRSHPGLHSPHLDRHSKGHIFVVDGDEDNDLPRASVRYALASAIHGLKHQYSIWNDGRDDVEVPSEQPLRPPSSRTERR